MTRALPLVLLVPVWACTPAIPDVDGGPSPADAGTTPVDAGAGATEDAGPHPDASAGAPDASAGAPDASGGTDDAGPAPHDAGAGAPDAGPPAGDAGPSTIAGLCFADIAEGGVGPVYDGFGPVVGDHCYGTHHQHITGVERVVFLGDSVTVGTPPTSSGDFYRTKLANALATQFGLEAPGFGWQIADYINGTAGQVHSGDFWSCAEWGARTDDLMQDNNQVLDCFPPEERDKTTLVVITMGGNDIAALTKDGPAGVPYDQIWQNTEEFVQLMRDAVQWMLDPTNVPGTTYVVFANMFEFTDGTGEIDSCVSAQFAGFDPWENPDDLAALVIYANEQYMDIAVSTGTDMIFMLEHFCGHGFNYDDPTSPCYRGPDAERWFDISCTHPNPTGHQTIFEMFSAVVQAGPL